MNKGKDKEEYIKCLYSFNSLSKNSKHSNNFIYFYLLYSYIDSTAMSLALYARERHWIHPKGLMISISKRNSDLIFNGKHLASKYKEGILHWQWL